MVKRILIGLWTAGLGLIVASAALAQAPQIPPAGGYRPGTLLDAVISTVVFSLIGIFLAIAGFKLFDFAIPFSLEREICEKNNLAVALLASSMILGICIIVAFVVLS
jgi:hypothetical protein